MIRAIFAFMVVWFLVAAMIETYRGLKKRARFKLAKTLLYAFGISAITVGVVTTIVFLF